VQSVNHVDSLSQLIFAPDPLSRFQYEKVHGGRQNQADDEALRALMLAVLEDGIACFQAYYFQPSRTNKKLLQEADEWIHSDDDDVFSFNNVCETLGLNPEKLRKGLERWKAKQMGLRIEERSRLILNKGKSRRKRKIGRPVNEDRLSAIQPEKTCRPLTRFST
jgi:hypothetical protein